MKIFLRKFGLFISCNLSRGRRGTNKKSQRGRKLEGGEKCYGYDPAGISRDVGRS
jgi:hypothetical protein